MITTEGEKGRIAQAIDAGVSDYIVKPFDREKLRAKLEDNLNKKPAASSPQWHPEFVSRPNPSGTPTWAIRRA